MKTDKIVTKLLIVTSGFIVIVSVNHVFKSETPTESNSVFKTKNNLDLHNGVYRQNLTFVAEEDWFRSRKLKALDSIRMQNGTAAHDAYQELSLIQNGSGDANGGKLSLEDDGDSVIECRSLHKKNFTEDQKCTFVTTVDDCQIDEGLVDYTKFVYCDFSSSSLWLSLIILFIWWLFLLIGIAVTADDFTVWAVSRSTTDLQLFRTSVGHNVLTNTAAEVRTYNLHIGESFCPALAIIAKTLRLSDNIAIRWRKMFRGEVIYILQLLLCAFIYSLIEGVTFLSFGNGSPDIFSAIAAIGNAKNGDAGLAFGALFGASVFVTTVVAGVISIICPFVSMQRPLLRDIIFHIIALFFAFLVFWDKKITQLEAIGFILLYVVYVIVLIVGRYIYVKSRDRNKAKNQPTEASSTIQESPRQSSVESTDEKTHLLNNLQLEVVTTPTQEFLQAIRPIDTENWREMRMPKKIFEVFKSPLLFFLIITIPVVNPKKERDNWVKYLQVLQCLLGPMFGIFATNLGSKTIGSTFPAWALVLTISVMLAIIVFFTSSPEQQPKYHKAFAYLGFLVAVIWIYSIANEIVNILQAFGIVINISNDILGLTLLAWGNSMGDLIPDLAMARSGYPRIGISACFGGSLFNLLLGVGIPFTIGTIKLGGPYNLKVTVEEIVLAAALAASLVSSLIIVPLSGFKFSRPLGIYLIVLYFVFLIIAILAEVDVIHGKF